MNKQPAAGEWQHLTPDDIKWIDENLKEEKAEDMMGGYEKFVQAGKRLKNQEAPSKKVVSVDEQYEAMTTDELEQKKEAAEKWLRENKKNPKYGEAMKRYAAICDALIKLTLSEE